MIRGQWFPQGTDITAALSIRETVLLRGRDNLDDIAQQVVVYQGEIPVGTARLWWQEGAFHLGDVAVLEDFRRKGLGDFLVRLLLFKALTHHAVCVELQTLSKTVPFFARYGFVPVAEEGMLISMRVRREDIALSHCTGECP